MTVLFVMVYSLLFLFGILSSIAIGFDEIGSEICHQKFAHVSSVISRIVSNLSAGLDQSHDRFICIVSRHTDEISPYSQYSLLLQRLYSALHGYKLFIIDNSSRNDEEMKYEDYIFYPKLSFLLSIMQQNIEQCAYVAWMDADFVPIDINYPLEKLIEKHRDEEIIASKDVSNIINTGSLLLRNSEWTRRLLLQWLMMRHNPNVINDQTGFDYLYSRYMRESDKQKLAILEPNEFNSVLPAMSQQLESDKFLHLAAEDDAYRSAVFCHGASIAASVIASYPTTFIAHFPSQLGLVRSTLLDIGLFIYGQLADNIKSNLFKQVQDDDVRLETIMSLLSRYRTVASKYVHALVASVSHENIDFHGIFDAGRHELLLSLEQRWDIVNFYGRLYQAMIVENIGISSNSPTGIVAKTWNNVTIEWPSFFSSSSYNFAFQKSQISEEDVLAVTPEMMKMLAEVSYEYLLNGEEYQQSEMFANSSSSVTTALTSQLLFTRSILIPNVLSILLQTVHFDQRHIVESMIEEFRGHYGDIPLVRKQCNKLTVECVAVTSNYKLF